jgi:hypothetical protein
LLPRPSASGEQVGLRRERERNPFHATESKVSIAEHDLASGSHIECHCPHWSAIPAGNRDRLARSVTPNERQGDIQLEWSVRASADVEQHIGDVLELSRPVVPEHQSSRIARPQSGVQRLVDGPPARYERDDSTLQSRVPVPHPLARGEENTRLGVSVKPANGRVDQLLKPNDEIDLAHPRGFFHARAPVVGTTDESQKAPRPKPTDA